MKRLSLILVAIISISLAFTSCEHVHEFDPVSQVCECGEMNPDAVFEVDTMLAYGPGPVARFTNASDMLTYVGQHQSDPIKPTVKLIKDVACDGLSVNNLAFIFDTQTYTLTFTENGCLEISGNTSEVTIEGSGALTKTGSATYLIKVNGGKLTDKVAFNDSVYVASDAQLHLSGDAQTVITGYVTEDEADRNLYVEGDNVYFSSISIASESWDNISSSSTYEAKVLDHNHTFDDYSCCDSCGFNKYAKYFTITNGVLSVSVNSKASIFVGGVCIPEGVTEISGSTFSSCTQLTKVKLPQTLQKIKISAFNNTGLTEVTIPSNVSTIEYSAFSDSPITEVTMPFVSNRIGNTFTASNIEEVTITGSPTAVPEAFFSYLSSLETVNLPSTITSYGANAFMYCSSLESFTIATGVTAIPTNMFYECTSLESVVIPTGVTTIDGYAFYKTGLTSVSFPSTLESIGTSAFSNCTSLSGTITLPSSVTELLERTFNECTGITGVVLSAALTDPGYAAFCDCTNLTSITIPSGMKKIGFYMFVGCSNLETVSIPTSVNKIESGAFGSCTKLTSIQYAGTTSQWNNISKWLNGDPSDWNYNCPATVTCLGDPT